VIYSLEHECDLGIDEDPVPLNKLWKVTILKMVDATIEKLKLMDDNKVWNLVELPKGAKWVGCKWVFKTKRDSKENIEKYMTRLVTKGYTKKG